MNKTDIDLIAKKALLIFKKNKHKFYLSRNGKFSMHTPNISEIKNTLLYMIDFKEPTLIEKLYGRFNSKRVGNNILLRLNGKLLKKISLI